MPIPRQSRIIFTDTLGRNEALPHFQDEADLSVWVSDISSTSTNFRRTEGTTTSKHPEPPVPRQKDPAYIIVFGVLACLLFIAAIVVLVRSWRKKKRRQKVARKVAFRESPSAQGLSQPVRLDKVASALRMADHGLESPATTPRVARSTVKFAPQTSVKLQYDNDVPSHQEA